jgi:hypothetical protein
MFKYNKKIKNFKKRILAKSMVKISKIGSRRAQKSPFVDSN